MKGEQFRRYLDQSISPTLALQDGVKVRRGDVVDFRVVPQWRTSGQVPVFIRVHNAHSPMEGRVVGSICTGEATAPTMMGASMQSGMLLIPDRVGPLTVSVDVSVVYGPAAVASFDGWFNPGTENEQADFWNKVPATTVVTTARCELEVGESTAAECVLDSAGLDAGNVRSTLPGVSYWFDGDEESHRFVLSLSIARPDIDFAFDVVARQDGQEHPLGWLFASRVETQSILAGSVRGLNPERPIDIVLRSNRGLLERPFWAPRLWQGELVIPAEVPRARPLPGEPNP